MGLLEVHYSNVRVCFVATGKEKKPLGSRNKSSGIKHKKPLKTKRKDVPLVSRQGFRSTLKSAQPTEAHKEADSSSESDSDEGDSPTAVVEASCADKGPPSDTKPVKEKKRYILFVGNLPYTADVSSVLEYFKKHGTPAKEARMLSDKTTGKSRGCCFVEFDTSRTQQVF